MRWNRGSFCRDDRVPRSDQIGDSGVAEEGVLDCSLEELREFIEADLVDVHADPEFKQSLRQRLWEMVQARNRLRGPGPGQR